MSPVVVGLGEVLWDLFPDGRRPGGAPANVAFQANQLGLTGVVMSRVGGDELGREMLSFLRERGLTTDYVQVDPGRPTGTVTVRGTPTGPEFTIHEDTAWDRLGLTPEWETILVTADAVCYGTLGQRSGVSREAIDDCIAAATRSSYGRGLMVFDVNLRQQWFSREVVDRSITWADIVKLNEAEVPVVAELLGLPARPDEFAAAIFDRNDAWMVCVTRGGEGCLAFTQGESVRVAPERVTVVDTVGAGDAFTAGLIYARLQEWPLEKAARFANAVGGLAASKAGAMPELREEFAGLKERFG